MNTLTHAAAASNELGWLLGGMTLAFLIFFTAWTVWAWAPANRDRLNAAARMPLDEG